MSPQNFEKFLPKDDDVDAEAKIDFNLGDDTEQNFKGKLLNKSITQNSRSNLQPLEPKVNHSVSYSKIGHKITAMQTEEMSELDTSAVIEGNMLLGALNKDNGTTIDQDKELSSASWRRLKETRSHSAIQVGPVKT